MSDRSETIVPTRLGNLRVYTSGAGSPAVFWHSLFVDSTTWQRVRSPLALSRRLFEIDGPAHGASDAPTRLFTLEECAGAALDVLDHFDIAKPVDWVGNAWGGHVGILLAAAHPTRCRTLITIGTPIHALTATERPKIAALVALYRRTGPIGPLVKPVVAALLGPQANKVDPEAAHLVADAFRRPGRQGMYLAVRSALLNRQDLTAAFSTLTIPALVVAGSDDPLWTPTAAHTAAKLAPNATTAVVEGAGHVAPLLHAALELSDHINTFWTRPDPRFL